VIRDLSQLTDPHWRHLVGLAPGEPIHVFSPGTGWGIHVDRSDDEDEVRPYFITAGNSQVSLSREELAALVRDVSTHLAATAAPSEPVQDKPRVWSAAPAFPDDVKAFRDAEGRIWRRDLTKRGWRRDTGAWTENDPLDLLRYHPRLSPITEVVEPDPEATP
jgi:hypothetical protein